jgi:hypothetical protein
MGHKTRCLCYCQTILGMLWGALSDKRGLLVSASAVIPGSESHRIHDHILLPQIQDSLTWNARYPYLYPFRNRVAQLYPRHWAPFSSPPKTRRTTVELFVPTSMQGAISQCTTDSLCSLGSDRIENTTSKSSSIVVCVCCLVMALGLLCSHSCYIAMAVSLAPQFLL